MQHDFGVVFYTEHTPMMGVAKKIIEAIGYPDKFCIYINVELKRIAIARDNNSNCGVAYSETEETNDYYWLKGGMIFRIVDKLGLPDRKGPYYLHGKYIEADQAVTCEGLNCVIAELPTGNVPHTIMNEMLSTDDIQKTAKRKSENKSRILKEDVNFFQSIALTNEHKNVAEDENFGWMVESALRYSLGRDGCSPEKTADFIRKHINQFDETTLFVMKRDVDAALQRGDLPCDVIWRSVSEDLSIHLEVVKQARNGNIT